MNNPFQQRAELHAEAQAFFEQLRERPGDETLLTQLTEWVGKSADHRAVYDAVAVTWISTLINQAVEAPETRPGHDTTVH